MSPLVEDRPESVEEAGALLGAAITLCGTGGTTVNAPPKGMHSAFATISSLPSSDLFTRLYYLRAMLRAWPRDEPLVAAPSLLAVLMKLLSSSTQLAAKNASQGGSSAVQKRNNDVPPMLSIPLRKLWVDCVVLCHRLGEGLSGTASTSLFSFLKNMIFLAGMNPKSSKASGGGRISAVDAIGGLMEDEKLASKLAGWSHDILQLGLRALRSAGNGEPSYRIAALKMACGVAKACRIAHLKTKPLESPRHALLLQGAFEGPALIESIKILRQAVADKFPEVRSIGATFAALITSMLVLPSKSRPPSGTLDRGEQPTAQIVHLEEVLSLALKNIDDEMVDVAAGWAEALAWCICTSIELGARKASSAIANRDVEADQDQAPPAEAGLQRGTRRKDGPVALCKDLKSAISLLVRNFVKVGGELSAARAGGMYSSAAGRAVRIGLSNCLVKLLRIQSTLGMIGDDERGLSLQETVALVLQMAAEDVEKQFTVPHSTQTLDVTAMATTEVKSASGNALFGAKRSAADAGLVRVATGKVLRLGISELASETTQLSLLQSLLELLKHPAESENAPKMICNAHQLQVVLIEISHLLSALGEAAASKIDDLATNLKACLGHADHGVRHEAAVACSAFVLCFPAEGRKMLKKGLKDLQEQHAELMEIANRGESIAGECTDPKRSGGLSRMFRRPRREAEKPKVDHSLTQQCAIHGISLMISIIVRKLPCAAGGLEKRYLTDVLSMAEMLVSCQFNDVITNINPAVACTCVRAGFGIITGLLAAGHVAVEPHTKRIFVIFQKSYKSSIKGTGGKFGVDFELSCIEVVLSSIVAFLSYCSELLLTVPECLTKVNVMLEELLLSFSPEGRFGKESSNPAAVMRLKSSKASLMEAFAWLPSGSFPMAADAVFAFAALQIRSAIAAEVTCSILPALISKEDCILDAKSVSRVERVGQAGGAKELEESIVALTSEVAQHGEREAVLHFPRSHAPQNCDREFRKSQILGMLALDTSQLPPTPLHAAVGTWRKPLDVSCSSTVRLLDAAIQAYSATFGLKSGNEQQEAVEMLESLMPPFLTQLAGTIGMNTALAEQATRTKPKEDNAAVANITAVLLSCLKALPLHEATHNIAVSLGPPWMNKAKDVFLTLLPSPSNTVRRAAAEGLALLATLGVTEDAHFLQSSVLHSLDQVMQGNLPDGKPRTSPFEPVSASRAGSLLTLACIQRMSQKVSETKMDRSKGRALSAEEVILKAEEALPTLQMMTRVLPSISRQGFRDFFIVETTGLHTFGLLLGYSSKLHKETPEAEDLQLLRKGAELVEDKFVASWTAASADFDAGQEAEKLGAEVSFLAVLVRLMTLLVPSLGYIHSENPAVASRFSYMASLVLELRGSHPVVGVECMAFFEVLAKNQHILPPISTKMIHSDNPIFCCIPYCFASLKPSYADVFMVPKYEKLGCLPSPLGFLAVLRLLRVMSASGILEEYAIELGSSVFAFLEAACTSRCFSDFYRPLAAPRAAEHSAIDGLAIEKEATEVLRALQATSRATATTAESGLLRWILFLRALVANQSSYSEAESSDLPAQSVEAIVAKAEATAARDVTRVFEYVGQVRWQIKSTAVLLALGFLNQIRSGATNTRSPNFDYNLAEESIQRSFASGSSNPPSRLVLHLSKIVPMACSCAVAAVDQAELPTLQLAGVLFLTKVVACFSGIPDPQQPDALLLDQYTTQIFSCLKHNMSDEAYHKRFWVGCQCIQTIAEKEITNDSVALKRIIRPTIPLAKDTPLFSFGDSCVTDFCSDGADNPFGDKRGSLLVHIGKVWTAGKLLLMKGKAHAPALRQLVEDEGSLAVHSAAVAFDGARLLLGANATLCGLSAPAAETVGATSRQGFLYDDAGDVDDSVKAAMVATWSSCGCFALRSLVQKSSTEPDESRKQTFSVWVRKLVPLLSAGLNDCIDAFGTKEIKRAPPMWCGGAKSSVIAVNCLHGLRVFVEEPSGGGNYEDVDINMDQILDKLRESVILRWLFCGGGSKEDDAKSGSSLLPEEQEAVLEEICDLIKELAATKTSTASSALLISILKPLDLLQRKMIDYSHSHVELIVSTCLVAASTLISRSKTEDTFVSSLTRLSLDVMSAKAVPCSVSSAARGVLKGCLSHKAITASDRCLIAQQLAKIGDWETWSIVCAGDDGLAAARSMEALKKVVSDPQDSQQLDALSSLLQLAQAPNSVLVGIVMKEAGAAILNILKMYGTNGALSRFKRPTACADSMKIILVACQQLSDNVEDQVHVVAFLMVAFEYMLVVLRYNGLPNHPPPRAESDPFLGRIMAQAIVHIARILPSPFKNTLISMQDADRSVLEFAVRAEMGGYANTSVKAPAKKALNLKGFKK